MKKLATRSVIFAGLLFLAILSRAQYPAIEIIGTSVPPYDWSAGVNMPTTDGNTYTLLNYTLPAGEVKFRQNSDWTVNWGATSFPTGTGYQDGPNIPIPAGTYNISFSRQTGQYNFECPSCYCTAGLYDANYGCVFGSAINDFSLADIHQIATGCSGQLADYTSLNINLSQGESYFFNAASTSSGYNTTYEFLGIWIDFNDNKSFGDPGEMLFASASGGEFSGVITIPASATMGNHRMRVRLKADYSLIPFSLNNSCTFYNYGEAHDYTVNISAAPSCTGLSSLTISNIEKFSATVSWGCNGCAGPFVVEYGPQGFTPGTGATAGTNGTIVNATSSPAVLSGLTSATSYDVYVRRSCGSGNYSLNFGPFTFTTKYNACGTIQSIVCGQTYTANIPTGPGEFDYYPNTGGSIDGKELVYQFTPTLTGKYILSVSNTNFYAASYFIKEAALGCDRYSWRYFTGIYSGPASALIGTLNAGITYYLLIDVQAGFGAIQDFQINCASVFDPCPPTTTIVCNSPVSFTIPAGPGKFDIPTTDIYTTLPGKEVIFAYTATQSGRLNMSLTPGAGLFFTSGAGVYIKNASGGCNENGWTSLGFTYGVSSFSPWLSNPYTVVTGNSYLIMVDALSISDEYSLVMQVSCPEVWDPCSSVTTVNCGQDINVVIPQGLGKYDTVGTACLFGYHYGKEIIYSFTPSQSGFYTINVSSQSTYGIALLMKEAGTCDENGWKCYPDVYNPRPLQAGSTYYIMFDAPDAAGASLTFNMSCNVPPDPCLSISMIDCNTTAGINLPAGPGGLYPRLNYYFLGGGTEKILRFTPAITGTYFIKTNSMNGSILFLIKEASDGCNENNWKYVDQNVVYDNRAVLIPMQLKAGSEYLLLAENGSTYFGTTADIQIICSPAYNPCSSISIISGCGVSTTATMPAGVGNFVGCGSFYYYYGSGIPGPAGKEKIYQFTPSVSGRYVIRTTAGSGEVSFAFKSASSGCNGDGWNCIGNAGGPGYYYPSNLPIAEKLMAGITYYFMVDANDTIGASNTFELTCPDNYNPCNNITEISCGNGYVNVTTIAGYGTYFGPGCDPPYQPSGKELIYEFTAGVSGSYILETSNYLSFQVYFKKSSLGCDATGWTCLGGIYNVQTLFTPALIAGQKYMIMFIPGSDYGVSTILSFRLLCPANCTIYADADLDGYGDPERPFQECYNVPYGYSANNYDCNDANENIHPGAIEICGNNIDDNCNGQVDEGCGCPIAIHCPANIEQSAQQGKCYKSIHTPNPVTTSNCTLTKLTWVMTGATTGSSPSTGINYVGTKTFNVGTTTITYTATNASGTTATCHFTVRVTENIPPTIACPSKKTVNTDDNQCYATNVNLGNPVVNDNCGIASVTNNAPAQFPVGNTIVTWTVTDNSGNVRTCTQTVTVKDKQDPEIVCSPDVFVFANNGQCYATNVNLSSPVTSDNCGVASVTNNHASSTYPIGTTTVKWTVKDVNGNTKSCTQKVTVVDDQSPVITCPANINANAGNNCNKVINTPNPSVSDNCGVSRLTWAMTGATTGSSSSNGINYAGTKTFNVGVTTVTYTAKDASGNSASCSFTVTVTDNQSPVIYCPSNIVQNASNGQCQRSINTPNPYTDDNCGVTKLTWRMTGATTGVSPSAGINYVGTKTFNAGITTITYTAKDAANNSTNCSFTVRINGPSYCNPASNTRQSGAGNEKKGIVDNESDKLAIKVYPNPSEQYFMLEIISGSNDRIDIAVFDATGRLVKKLNAETPRLIRLGDDLKTGFYMVEVRQGANRRVVKVVKQ